MGRVLHETPDPDRDSFPYTVAESPPQNSNRLAGLRKNWFDLDSDRYAWSFHEDMGRGNFSHDQL